ncbi:hypothetical protein OAM34_00080 [Alphaproteobacteria bacterium]|nr:hypothetical protein [Alphaproteobacteria bacterium]
MKLSEYPIWIVIIDYYLGALMWTLIGRTGMSLFLQDNSDFFFMRVFVKFTQPIINFCAPITPAFLVDRLKPLYIAWFFFMIRFYIFPLLLGYSVMGILSFPLESEIANVIYDLGLLLTTKK